jgi:pimeloyl-ACP methyl ester carboxylesterase
MLHHTVKGSGPPILLIHGTGGHSLLMAEVAEKLAATHRVINVDRRGYGGTVGPVHPRKDHYLHHARDAVELLGRLGASPATVVGWSGGGIVALAMALRHPETVEQLILFEPPLHARAHMTWKVFRAFAKTMFLRAIGRKREGVATFFRLATGNSDGTTSFDQVPAEVREAVLARTDGVFRELEAGTGEELTEKELATLKHPTTLLVSGRSEQFLRDASSRLIRLVPAIRVVRLPEATHSMPLEQPAEFVAEVRRAIAGHAAA